MSDREMGFEKISLGESMKMAFSFQKKGKDTQKSKSQSIISICFMQAKLDFY